MEAMMRQGLKSAVRGSLRALSSIAFDAAMQTAIDNPLEASSQEWKTQLAVELKHPPTQGNIRALS